jgi:hypothetical protein
MLKSTMLLFLLMGYYKALPQTCRSCYLVFVNNFLHFPLQTSRLEVWHYKAVKFYTPEAPQKKNEVYNYVHNGDDLKGAEDIIMSNAQGTAWLRNFDVGEFASATIDVGADTHGSMNGAFVWGGKLLFFKVLDNQKLGGAQYKSN